MEIYKPIKGFEELYEVSNYGNVKSKLYGRTRILKERWAGRGYLFVTIRGRQYYIHKLVASMFIANEQDKPCINHKNGIKKDNRVENLERCTYSENERHSADVLGKKYRS